ncbi:hypothetical protein RFUL19S_00292 [Rhizobacter fulvus]
MDLRGTPSREQCQRAVDSIGSSGSNQHRCRAVHCLRHRWTRAHGPCCQFQASSEFPRAPFLLGWTVLHPATQSHSRFGNRPPKLIQHGPSVESPPRRQPRCDAQRAMRIVGRRRAQAEHHRAPSEHPKLVAQGLDGVQRLSPIGAGQYRTSNRLLLSYPSGQHVPERACDSSNGLVGGNPRDGVDLGRKQDVVDEHPPFALMGSDQASLDALGQRGRRVRIGEELPPHRGLPAQTPFGRFNDPIGLGGNGSAHHRLTNSAAAPSSPSWQ